MSSKNKLIIGKKIWNRIPEYTLEGTKYGSRKTFFLHYILNLRQRGISINSTDVA